MNMWYLMDDLLGMWLAYKSDIHVQYYTFVLHSFLSPDYAGVPFYLVPIVAPP